MTIPVPASPDVEGPLAAWLLPRIHARAGLDVVTPVPDARLPRVGPFVSIARFTLSDRVFPPHPHAGFTALTYVLRGSPGTMLNRDSLGTVIPIQPGGAHWTIANAGMMHEETPEIDDVPVEGFLIFINHPLATKDDPPLTRHAEPGGILDWHDAPGARVRLIMGPWGARYVLSGMPIEATMAEVTLDQGASLAWERGAREEAMIYAEAGTLEVVAGASSVDVGARGVVAIDPDALAVELKAGADGALVFAFAGVPLGEAAVMGGPFIMGTQAAIERAFARFRSGAMGHLAARQP